MTDPPPRRPMFASTPPKIAVGLLAVIVLSSIPMVIAEARRRADTGAPSSLAPAGSSRQRAMSPPANAPRSALSPGERAEVAFQVVSLKPGGRVTGRVLQPTDPTTLTRSSQTITIALQPGVTAEMGSAAHVKPGALLQADGTIGNDRELLATRLVVLTGYVQLR